ncbi:MAG TPA: hypothetical protein VFC21_12915, partial [Bryobacteraceae bacterium]|nr:hypothetical protein [Bryobacteraceae bacterium]
MPIPKITSGSEPIDAPLMRAIHASAREHGVSRDELHEAIQAGFQLKSLKDLTKAQAYKLLDGIRAGRSSDHFKPNARRKAAQASH